MPTTQIDYHKNYRKKHKGRMLKYQKEYRAKHKKALALVHRKYQLLSRYGITPDDYDKMLKEQKGCCAICGRHQMEFDIRLCVDHSHKTGEIRRLLCYRCNVDLGIFENRYDEFMEYLERNKS